MITSALGAVAAPRANLRALEECAASLWRHRSLSWEMIKRDLGGQYAGQVLGRLWIIGNPLILYAVYVFIFGVVIKTRLTQDLDMPRDYTTYILAGLAPWLATQQALARTPTALISQSNLVKQVVFPIEVLPLGAIVAASIPLLIGIAVVLIRSLLLDGNLPVTILLLPIAMTIHAAIMLGIGYLLAAVTPFFRDIKDIIGAVTLVGVYLVPAFYLPQWVPPALQPWLYLNPFSYVIWMYQDVLYYGAIRHPVAWLLCIAMALAGLALGYRSFQKLKPYVANVL